MFFITIQEVIFNKIITVNLQDFLGGAENIG